MSVFCYQHHFHFPHCCSDKVVRRTELRNLASYHLLAILSKCTNVQFPKRNEQQHFFCCCCKLISLTAFFSSPCKATNLETAIVYVALEQLGGYLLFTTALFICKYAVEKEVVESSRQARNFIAVDWDFGNFLYPCFTSVLVDKEFVPGWWVS